ncbi:MAG: DUF5309 domain-containing protein, partial [Deferribacteraceae bacterium]|nr:DUF5309 domain-containing protein [Deferribacteraceae bacterium]
MSVTSTGVQAPLTSREGNQPSVLDAVIIVGSSETPILSRIGKGSHVTNVLHSWNFDTFPTPRRNPRKEIDVIGATPSSTKQKLSNAVEIFERSFGVSWDQQK